jgi:hypothetical protein
LVARVNGRKFKQGNKTFIDSRNLNPRCTAFGIDMNSRGS